MGSFAYTCAVSGLPIEAGHKVRYLMLTKNPYHDGADHTCYMHDLWFPRTFALKAKYNDYGSVEDVEEGYAKDIWLEGLAKDLVERGWGDNTCHDVPTNRSMTFDELLTALWEGRILVKRETDTSSYFSRKDKLTEDQIDDLIGKGIPTIRRIQKVIDSLNIAQFDGSWTKDSLIVASPRPNEVSVRCHGFYATSGPKKQFTSESTSLKIAILEKVQAALTDYAVLMSAGSDGFAVVNEGSPTTIDPGAELLIRPKPGTHNGTLSGREDDYTKRPLPVAQCMIREDVWQAMLRFKVETYGGKDYKRITVGIDDYRQSISKLVDDLGARRKKLNDLPDVSDKGLKELLFEIEFDRNNRDLGGWITKDVIPFTVGLGSHFKLMLEKDEVPEDFINGVAELAFIHSVLADCRYQWHPGSSAGPQFGEYKSHEDLLNAFSKIAKRIRVKQEKDRGE